MSLDTASNLKSHSPTSSGRSSPVPKAPRRTVEDALYKKDRSYRRYASGVERALSLFDTAQQEWADYISFLARLLKAIQAHPLDIPIIPHSTTVATRLAQCLNPTLPSGVHQKALDVYSYIFSVIGKDALSRDLSLYFPGLAPVLSFASLSVRPLFLSLLENYILTLDSYALRPALKAIILCLLPGLEEETGEDFERMVQALDKLRQAVTVLPDTHDETKADGTASHYWQCFFLATITNPSRRQGALAFLVRRLPKFGIRNRRSSISTEKSTAPEKLSNEAESAISPEPGLLIRCFAAGLSDSQLLIQRGFLDLLVSHLPLDSPVLQERINHDDLERLVAAAAGVVSRRDMSLNRRLWTWFLGPEPSAGADANEPLASPTQNMKNAGVDVSSHHAAYFSQYGLRSLTRSIMKMIQRPSPLPADRSKPFRICLSLMDRWEVGGLIVPEIFVPALQSVQIYSETSSKEQLDEVMRSASVFFDGVESGLIWGKLVELVTSALRSDASKHDDALRKLRLAKFILGRFNAREEEMLMHHMPLMALSVLVMLNKYAGKSVKEKASAEDISTLAYDIVDSLIQLIPERALLRQQNDTKESTSKALDLKGDQITSKITSFYIESHGNLDFSEPPFDVHTLGQLCLHEAGSLFEISLRSESSQSMAELCARILATLIYKVQDQSSLHDVDLLFVFHQILSDSSPRPKATLPLPCLVAITSVLSALQTANTSNPYVSATELPDLLHPLIAMIWHYLSPFKPKYHVEAVRCLWQLHSISSSGRLVEAAITTLMVCPGQSSQENDPIELAGRGRRFAVLWTHTIHEQSLQTEKRGSTVSRRFSGITTIPELSPSTGGFQSVLTRPLLLLLDALAEEGTGLFAFVKCWLQDLPTLDKVFEVLARHLQSLQSLKEIETLASSQAGDKSRTSASVDDTKECLYYLKHVLNILRWPSSYTWLTLAEEAAPQITETVSDAEKMTLQEWIVRTSMKALSVNSRADHSEQKPHIEELYRTAVSIVLQVFQSPYAAPLKALELEVPLMARLKMSSPSLQSLILEAILAALKLRLLSPPLQQPPSGYQRKQSRDVGAPSRLSLIMERPVNEEPSSPIPPPPQLVECLRAGFASPSSRLVLDDWVKFLAEVLPLFADAIFQNLIPLVECFCAQIDQVFEQLRSIFKQPVEDVQISPESTLISLMNGLEQILAKAHDRLVLQETRTATAKSPEQPQGFFGNMVSGVFSSEINQTRTPTANSRLTVLLCFQDTVRICFSIWSWGGYGSNSSKPDPTSLASFGYTSLRMRNRARRILEHLFAAEALECLETLAVLWCQSSRTDSRATSVMSLLNVLNGSKPKHTIPAIFNAVYSRTNPNALDPMRMSTLTSDLSDTDLVSFLVDYTKSLEDDAMDEIWPDCMIFLRDVLANPLPHRQILPTLLEFTAVLGQKVDNTNFGEQRKMRRELGDLFARLLTAVFTTRSMSFLQEPSQVAAVEKASSIANGGNIKRPVDVVAILTSIMPSLQLILVENDRVANTATSISTNIIGPAFRSKAFPENVNKSTLDLIYQLARVAQNNKAWKKDVADAFNDPRFFSTPLPLITSSWLPILAQWTLTDKDRLPELLSRLSAPTTAGIMFGVGAASARQEADRKTQLTLRRISLLLLAAPEDTFTPTLPSLSEKLVELLTATPASSPSSTTRAELFMLLRALLLMTSPVHLAPLWPIVTAELSAALTSLLPDADNRDTYSNAAVLQACKLLDTLVVLAPDDFQLHAWLFVADTIDAVYRPAAWPATALTDEVAEALAATDTPTSRAAAHHASLPPQHAGAEAPLRQPFLEPLLEAVQAGEEGADVRAMTRPELAGRVLKPFLGQLGIAAFEATYGMGVADWEACRVGLLRDLCED